MLRRKNARSPFDQQRLFIAALMNHDGPCSEITESLMPLRTQHRDDADKVERRQVVDDAQQIARHRLKQCDLAARVLDHAQLHDVLTRRLPVPEGLKKGVVTPDEQEVQEDEAREGPLSQ